ncbi:hypothetical protein BvCmsB5655_03762 [Escherichia coli]|nr:hypothetical protein BvCmsB5655_03762 [Escherichia coli]VWN21565.1 Uncharacterised protein [Escherichia coli]
MERAFAALYLLVGVRTDVMVASMKKHGITEVVNCSVLKQLRLYYRN